MTANNTQPNSRLSKPCAESTLNNYKIRLAKEIGDNLSLLNDPEYVENQLRSIENIEACKQTWSAIKWYLNTQLTDEQKHRYNHKDYIIRAVNRLTRDITNTIKENKQN